jgi:hypothetical protein
MSAARKARQASKGQKLAASKACQQLIKHVSR